MAHYIVRNYQGFKDIEATSHEDALRKVVSDKYKIVETAPNLAMYQVNGLKVTHYYTLQEKEKVVSESRTEYVIMQIECPGDMDSCAHSGVDVHACSTEKDAIVWIKQNIDSYIRNGSYLAIEVRSYDEDEEVEDFELLWEYGRLSNS